MLMLYKKNTKMTKLTNKTARSKKNWRTLTGVPILTVASLLVIGGALIPSARADQFDEQIKQLQSQNAQSQGAVSQLQVQASNYQDAINKLQGQIGQIQQQITDNQTKQANLQKQIDDDQNELDRQRKALGSDIKAMYVDGSPTTIEMLASSHNLSDFVDKEEYRTTVQNKIQDTLKKIAALQNQLKEQKTQVDNLLKDQKNQQAQLDSDKAQQDQLLGYNQSQQSDYDQQIQSNQSKIGDLRAQQAAANRRLGGNVESGDPGHGGYPAVWDNAAQDSMLDNWGMFNRECVSYTAWKVYQTYGYMPNWGGHGNANQWPDSARAAGIPTGSTPKAHSVAISMGGAYGHAMWVEGVSGNTIHVSQYNYDLAGHYSEMSINGAGLTYIYFN